MNNEMLLLLSFAVIYGGALLAYRLFGKMGLYAVSALATVVANIEVMIVVDAFGLQQTLGNVLFGVTFLITDILSENEGKDDANRAVYMGIFASLFFLVISQSDFCHSITENTIFCAFLVDYNDILIYNKH